MSTSTPKPWYRPRNLILLAFALFATAIGRQIFLALTAVPGQSIDYSAKLQELVEATQPADGGPNTADAWPVLVDAITRKTEIEETIWPVADRSSGIPIDYSALMGEHMVPTYDQAHSWKEVEDRARIALQALRDGGVLARLDEITRLRRAVRPIPKGRLINLLLPELGQSRALARANGARMYQSHLAGDDAEFIAAYEQTLALARIIGLQGVLIDHLVGIAIQALADNQIRYALTERPFKPETCRALLAAMDRQLPLGPMSTPFEGERLCCMDIIQWTHTDDGHGSGRLIVSQWRQLGASTGGGPVSAGWVGSLFDSKLLNLSAIAFPSKAANIKKANEFYDLCIAFSKMSYAERAAAEMSPSKFIDQKLPTRFTILRMLLPAIDKSIASRTQIEASSAATRIMLALEIYRGEHNRYPDSLDALVPSILPVLPPEPYSAKGTWGYRLITPEEDTVRRGDGSPRPYLLYCFGADGKDNGGKSPEKDPITSPRTPKGFDLVLNTPRDRPPPPDKNKPAEAPTETPSEAPVPAPDSPPAGG